MSEKIDVISMFRNRTVKPVRFKHAGRIFHIAKILYTWVGREGAYPVHHFCVLTRDGDQFEISLNVYTMDWVIREAGTGS